MLILSIISIYYFCINGIHSQILQHLEKNYSCTSFMHPLRDEQIRSKVKDLLNSCNSEYTLLVNRFNFHSGICSLQYEYDERIFGQPQCTDIVNKILDSAPHITWGSEWGCYDSLLPINVTGYYQIYTEPVEMVTMGLTAYTNAYCSVNSLHIRYEVPLVCQMNIFGGYSWLPIKEHSCTVPEFEMPRFSELNEYKKSPIYCSLRIFFLYGYLKVGLDSISTRIENTINTLSQDCQSHEKWIFESIYKDLLNIFDLLIYHSVRKTDELHKTKDSEEIYQIMLLFNNYFNSYFNMNTAEAYHRSRFIHWYTYPAEKNVSFLDCGPYFKVTGLESNGAIMYMCLDGLHFKEEYGPSALITNGFIGINKTNTTNYHVKITFLGLLDDPLPRFACLYQHFNYKSFPAELNTVCTFDSKTEKNVTCLCTKPGFYALCQIDHVTMIWRPKNKLNNYSITFLHLTIIITISVLMLVILHIRCSTPASRIYAGPKRRKTWRKYLCFVDLVLQQFIIYICMLVTQLISIRYAKKTNCQLLWALSGACYWTSGLLNLVHSIITFSAIRSYNPYKLCIKLTIVTYAIGIMIAASFYSTVLQHNTTESCLPKNLKYTTAIPVLSFHIISCIFLSTYWIFRPYHFIDEWIGNFINTMIGLVLWVQLATKDESNDSSLYYDVTLIMLNLIRALIFAVYQIFFKYSTLGYYYRFLGFCVLYCCKRHSRKLHRDYMGSERNLSIQSYQDMMYTPSKYWKRSSVLSVPE